MDTLHFSIHMSYRTHSHVLQVTFTSPTGEPLPVVRDWIMSVNGVLLIYQILNDPIYGILQTRIYELTLKVSCFHK